MKKLMIMTNGLYGGGAERILQTIVGHIDYTKFEVTLYSLHKEEINRNAYKGRFQYRYVFSGANSVADRIKGWVLNNCSAKLFYFLFIRGRYDVEVAFIEGESTKIISGSTNKKSKKYAWVHCDLISNPWTSFLYKDIHDEMVHYCKFDEILCVSEAVRTAFTEKYGLEEDKVGVQYNPVDCGKVLSMSHEECDLRDKKCLRMIAIGRLVNQKGFDRLLRVVNQLRDDGYIFELYILGEGVEHEQLQNYIHEKRLEKIVHLLGYKDNPYCYMVASDVVVCSSRAEGFSTVLTEAVVLGVPIFSMDCAGVKELFGDLECGKIVENDEESMYDALAEMMKNPECLLYYRKMSLKRATTFSLENRMQELEKLFLE